jgi:outer membrane protein OmpA-like peptidoglycan-associated protein
MKILMTGFIVFVGWSVLSTYIYVCKIKGLCIQPETILTEAEKQNDTLSDRSEAEEKTPIPGDLVINFAFDKSNFVSGVETSEYCEKSNTYFLHNPEAKLSITGHTDGVGTTEYNTALGMRRAQALEKYFGTKGLPAERMILESKGENDPVDSNSSKEGRANNRRTIVTIKQ